MMLPIALVALVAAYMFGIQYYTPAGLMDPTVFSALEDCDFKTTPGLNSCVLLSKVGCCLIVAVVFPNGFPFECCRKPSHPLAFLCRSILEDFSCAPTPSIISGKLPTCLRVGSAERAANGFGSPVRQAMPGASGLTAYGKELTVKRPRGRARGLVSIALDDEVAGDTRKLAGSCFDEAKFGHTRDCSQASEFASAGHAVGPGISIRESESRDSHSLSDDRINVESVSVGERSQGRGSAALTVDNEFPVDEFARFSTREVAVEES